MVTTSFPDSPRMSSYLLAFVVSDFTYISNQATLPADGRLHRIYARTEDVARAQYALDNDVKMLNALVNYVSYNYELTKMFSAAIPDFGAGKIMRH